MNFRETMVAVVLLMPAAGTTAAHAESEPAAAGEQRAVSGQDADGTDTQPELICRKEYRAGTKIRQRVCYRKTADETGNSDEKDSGASQ